MTAFKTKLSTTLNYWTNNCSTQQRLGSIC